LLAEPLRRLRGLLIDLPDPNNETGMNIQPELNYPGAGARVCLCLLIDSHDADSLAPCAPLVCPMSSSQEFLSPALHLDRTRGRAGGRASRACPHGRPLP